MTFILWPKGPRKPVRRGPRLEVLEDRTLPAAVVTVGNLGDVVNGTTASIAALVTNPGQDGISLREALLAANNTAGTDEVTFQAGLNGTIRLLAGQLMVTDSVTVIGPGAGVVTIDASNDSRLFEIRATGRVINVAISGLTLTQGNAPPLGDGGAILVADEVLTLSGVVITASSAADGGGIAVNEANGRLTLENCTVSSNRAEHFGGGLFLSNSVTLIRNSTVSGNQNPNGNGGGIFVDNPVSLTVENST